MKIRGKYNKTQNYFVVTGESVFTELELFLNEFIKKPARIFILVDENTRQHCLPVLLSNTSYLKDAEILEIPSGEINKSIETAIFLWSALMARHADRYALLINLGGGVISDLGGFVGSTFQRGISYINIPTTLMAMVDAAFGGKTGLNLGEIKNQVGTFYSPEAVFIHAGFLKTITREHIANGFAEVIKYALIEDSAMWSNLERLHLEELLLNIPPGDLSLEELVERSVKIKCKIVEKDFHEEDSRKLLNFGHTFGHALEGLSMKDGNVGLHHGQAVAMGMILESRLSYKQTGLSGDDLDSIVSLILSNYKYYPLDEASTGKLLEYMSHDKKNRDKKLGFTLLQRPGKAVIDQYCEIETIDDALEYYRSLKY
jgi:3-dehydroquinate synthase